MKPANLKVMSFNETSCTLAWKDDLNIANPSQAGIARFVVEQSTDQLTFVPIDSLPATSSSGTVHGLFAINTPYWVRIYASVGGRVSPRSDATAFEIGLLGPANFLAVQVTESARRFTWLDRSSAEAYFDVERRQGAARPYLPVGRAPANATAFLDSSVIQTDSTYWYRLSAVSAAGTVSSYDSLSFEIPFAPPSGLVCAGGTPDSLTLQWVVNSPLAFGTAVEKSAGLSPFVVLATVGPNVSSIPDDLVTRNVSYGYRVRSVSRYNFSEYSPVTRVDYQCTALNVVSRMYPYDASVAFGVSRDGSRAVYVERSELTVWDLAGGSIVMSLPSSVTGPVKGAALSGDGRFLGIVQRDSGAFSIYSTSEKSLLRRISVPPPALDMAMSNDGSEVITTGADSLIRIWRTSDGSLVRSLSGHTSSPISLSMSYDGRTLISGGDKTVRVWDWQSGIQLRVVSGGFFTWPVYLLPDGDVYGITLTPAQVIVTDLTRGQVTLAFGFPGELFNTYSAYITVDGCTLCVGGIDEVFVFNLVNGTLALRQVPAVGGGGGLLISRAGNDSTFAVGGTNSAIIYKGVLSFGWVSAQGAAAGSPSRQSSRPARRTGGKSPSH